MTPSDEASSTNPPSNPIDVRVEPNAFEGAHATSSRGYEPVNRAQKSGAGRLYVFLSRVLDPDDGDLLRRARGAARGPGRRLGARARARSSGRGTRPRPLIEA